MNRIIVGDFVKTKRLKGVVDQIDRLGQYIVRYHNGMKPTTAICLRHQLTKISEQELIDYKAKRGDFYPVWASKADGITNESKAKWYDEMTEALNHDWPPPTHSTVAHPVDLHFTGVTVSLNPDGTYSLSDPH